MRFVDPKVRLIARSRSIPEQKAEWLREVGCDENTVRRYAESGVKNPAEEIIEAAGRRCYMSFVPGLNPNVQQIREDIADYCRNILKSGHGSVLEHATFTFTVENVSRVLTGELNRHRAGVAISEGSMRFIRYTDIPIVRTPLLTIEETDTGAVIAKKQQTLRIFERICKQIEDAYAELVEVWGDELAPTSKFSAKKHITSLLRRIIPMGVATGGIWTLNVRALRHVCEMRCSEAAEEEIALVCGQILEIMMREEPNLFGDFHKNESGYWQSVYKKV